MSVFAFFRPSKPWRRALLWGAAALVLAPLLAALGVWMYALTLRGDVPDLYTLRHPDLALSSIAYTADGVEIGRFHEQHRVWVGFGEISPHVVAALVATEDARFYEHHGIDWRRLASSVVATLRGRRQGGSTITMQLARNLFPGVGRERTPARKLREMLTARRLEKLYSKADIAEMYLNTVPFGYNAFGIEAAARVYFDTSASALAPAQAALLVGMLQATTGFNPVQHPRAARQRRNTVLALMHLHGDLTPQQTRHLQDEPLGLRFSTPTPESSIAPHFALFVRRWVEDWCRGHGCNVERDGLRIFTTLDSRLQAVATRAVTWGAAGLQAVADAEWTGGGTTFRPRADATRRPDAFAALWRARPAWVTGWIRGTPRYHRLTESGVLPDSALARLRADGAFLDSLRLARTRLDAGFVALDPATGEVRAWVGGRDWATGAYDHVAQSRRQPGSTFKPFVYAAAIDWGYRPDDPVEDRVRSYPQAGGPAWTPTNAGGGASGATITLRQALVQSKNTVSAFLIGEVGPGYVARIARRMGVVSPLREVPSLALGTSEVTLLEMVGAYATLAQNGERHPPFVVTRIENARGEVLATFAPAREYALSGSTAYTVLDMMRGVVETGTGAAIRRQYHVAGDLAGKTGTTQEGADGWFILIHPRLVAGAWVGFPDRRVAFRSAYWGQGAHNALHLVGAFFQQVQQAGEFSMADAAFAPPPGFVPPAPPDTLGTWDDSLGYDFDYGNAYDDLFADTLGASPAPDPPPAPRGRVRRVAPRPLADTLPAPPPLAPPGN